MRRAAQRYFGPIERSSTGKAGCDGKRAYRGIVVARRMARETSRDRDGAVQPYRCRHCGAWHVGGVR